MESEKVVTHWKKLTNPNYVGSHDLQPCQELKVTFEKVATEIVKTAEGSQTCVVAYFKGGSKPMILNKTNMKIISKVLDSPYIEKWIGQSVILYSAKIRAFGENVDALRIKNQKA